MINNYTDILSFDKKHLWHPYTSMTNPLPVYCVESASGVHINLASGESLIDGMSSWWSVIHGYNHPTLNNAVVEQTKKMAHVMFGGLTHKPAVDLAQRLVNLTPAGLDKVFLADSGSVSVEVAIKMAYQFWQAKGQHKKTRLLTVKNGYHGDTFAAMSVCDPVNGMHHMFENVMQQHLFAPAPQTRFEQDFDESELTSLTALFEQHHQSMAALIIEPIVQGAGGMRIYHKDYLKACRALCDKYDVLLICDEIATGFGRTGKMFACQWADITPDIMCLGKALTGGYMTLAATITTQQVADTISESEAGCFMHGPTFMGNPLACAVANASLSLFEQDDYLSKIAAIESQLKNNILPLKSHPRVADTRVLGAIGVVETHQPVNMANIQAHFVSQGVWIRPFGKLIYIMPPYVATSADLNALTSAIASALDQDNCFSAS
ncbi:adenosylmethionine--8-amino-7-oxononanoate transaminase [Thalassotalea agarivorans]|uniref:Adenosylmethionine-8-amino-7-oxononanoate aminotransferase n=1 Tax=Thalassotalea agarivorans TaxID=349064 RepID=A0A1I0F429_THASX|nr:adenosylmethionine--8-amino-7-oxononanoate transaminase [Thalassotalea agarivorans]SET52154.1 adenosylmethionine-8-amino-7-oxononanoate aminotransferase [Thalassotalea agarivorans]